MKNGSKSSKKRILPNTVAWEDVPKPPDFEKRIDRKIIELNLRAIRERAGLSQDALASAIDMTQSDLSKFERRSDHLVSRLRVFVEALGGRLEISAILNGKKIVLTDV